jgi:predicted MPP superfamily phosphohydrolase
MNRRSFLKSLLFAGGASLASGSVYAWQSVNLEVSRERIEVEGLKQELRVVALSDLHDPCYYLSTSDLVRSINAEKPDVLILAGDMFSTRNFEDLITGFSEVNASYAKLAVLGNWEYQLELDLKTLKKAYANADIELLFNDIYEINGLRLLGLDDLLCGSPDYRLARDISKKAKPELVISHCPGNFDRIAVGGMSQKIMVSGHTHGGQIAPFGKALVTPPGSGPYVQGWYRRGLNAMYVMRGVGASYLPVRIGARPELLVLDLLPI